MSSKPEKLKWQIPTPEQRVSHRTILRFTELAREFTSDLNRIYSTQNEMLELGVHFVSVDRHRELLPRLEKTDSDSCNHKTRYYNLRTLQTYRLTVNGNLGKEIETALEWMKADPKRFKSLFRCADNLEQHKHDSFIRFEQKLNALNVNHTPKELLVSEVHDLLIEAISAMPYTGLLPSSLDQLLHKSKSWGIRSTDPIHFNLIYKKDKVRIFDSNGQKPMKSISLKKSASDLIPKEVFKTDGEKQSIELGELYINKFINSFVLGTSPKNEVNKDDESPYSKGGVNLYGIGFPIYHFHTYSGSAAGGFEGWAVVIFADENEEKNKISEEQINRHLKEARISYMNSESFRLACRSFSRRIREERMRELIEKEWSETISDPRGFTLEHFRDFDGWFADPKATLGSSKPEPHWLFCFFRKTGDQIKIYDRSVKNDSHFIIPSQITHIAIVPPLKGNAPDWTRPMIFETRADTILPTEHDDVVAYGFHLTQSVHQIYEMASLKQARQVQDRLSGTLESAHDYSKDLNALDSQLARFSKELIDVRKCLQESKTETAAETRKRLNDLRVPEEWWLLRARFMMAHQRTETEGRLYEQPEWCLDLIKRGTRGAIIRLIKLLVWHPIDWDEHVEHARKGLTEADMDAGQAELSPRHLSDWSRLFSYDERGRNTLIDKMLGKYMRSLFVDEKIKEEHFWIRHAPPKLSGDSMLTQLLWAGLENDGDGRWKPVGTLCPLLVFSLRAAYQHAWLDGFLRAAMELEEFGTLNGFTPVTPIVTLSAIDDGTGFDLSFPDPNIRVGGSENSRDSSGKVRLPWGNWERELKHYKGLCHPWSWELAKNQRQESFHIRITCR